MGFKRERELEKKNIDLYRNNNKKKELECFLLFIIVDQEYILIIFDFDIFIQ